MGQLIGHFRDADPKNTSLTSGTAERLNGLLHVIRRDDTEGSKDRVVYCNRKIKGRRRESMYYYATRLVKPALHTRNCFEKYYTVQEYERSHKRSKRLTPMTKRITEELNEVEVIQCMKILLKSSENMKRSNSIPGLPIEIIPIEII
ncbi:uncharacterized protein LOC117241233 [Bombus vosnesenskii]|uniref:Uncharacterized protein LOC117238835 n=1 Tax=Bombus vosnesenskii TaxID=207650 RepID=A0A6J3L9C4_9HYME|nr:uncharacterized protein LOC117238835 [Bombus vosnesenskii]XP_033362198.1 uncharacterized protein LOC117240327 [Bombus vosnesenskii]XP_033363090.1 uncharacterized protein LOC117241233 [Bombus vosnesenskii]